MQSRKSNHFIFTCVGIGTFIALLNSSLITTILPNIRQSLKISTGQADWLVLIFLLVVTVSLIPLGRLSDIWGQRPLLLTGYIVFVCAAAVCGYSYNFLSILIGRALLGLGSAMILSVGPAILTTTFPSDQRGKVLGIQALITYLGLSFGPLIGGSITQFFGWQSAFLISIPLGIIGFIFCFTSVPQRSTVNTTIDVRGIVVFLVFMTSATLLLNSTIISNFHIVVWLLLLSLPVSLLQFLHIERKAALPMIDFSLFHIQNFKFGLVGAASNYLCFYLVLFIIPYYLNNILKSPPVQIGFFLTIPALIMTIVSPIAGTLSDRFGARIFSITGMCFSVISLTIFASVGIIIKPVTFILVIGGLICTGLGIGIFAAPNNSAIMSAVPQTHQGMASGTIATFRNIGMILGTTLGGTFFDLIYKYILDAGNTSSRAFLSAFSLVMLAAVFLGILGIICISHMDKRSQYRQHNPT
ncbi:MFS transporter [Pectinatus frisingensis]|uniref:MFS transporter n=1 Tax=Pectinatus frisingensis TaxID=865 RepID=UPI0018C77D12|nr:MFS transporter [Pectinatus frisingensis]